MSYAYRSSKGPFGSGSSRNRNNRNRGSRRKVSTIDPSRFIAKATFEAEEAYVPKHSFNDFEVSDLLKNNLKALGYENPSPIQDQTIPFGLEGRDVIGMASTGTGKTAAFALPILQKLIDNRDSRALIIAPTRELAEQIEDSCKKIAKGSGLFGVLLIGGTNMGSQLRDLRQNPRVVIGTPGRIKDHADRGTLKLEKFNLVVLDEVDRMLDMGFIVDVSDIVGRTNQNRQSFFFSATMEPKIRGLIDKFTNDPVTVSIKTSKASENVHQDVITYSGTGEKLSKLHDVLIHQDTSKTIIFDETQRSVERLYKELQIRGFEVDAIHGGKTQAQRQRALNRFKKNDIKVLVATNVAARGIDVSDISHVINYSPPAEYDDYIHRVGRAGRAGKVGYALTFISK